MSQCTTYRQAPSQGLVQCHKFGEALPPSPSGLAEISVYADVLKVHVQSNSTSKPRPRGDRKKITAFSKRSRKNMLTQLAMLRNPTGGLFVTLTYPGKFDYSPEEVKTHLERFRHALLYHFPDCGVFWRMELKERLSGASAGQIAPHFHLLVFLYQSDWTVYDFRAWLAYTWWSSVGSLDPKHREVGTQADIILNRKHAQCYASKYAAKEDELLINCQDLSINPDNLTIQSWGRRWGKFGALNLAEMFTVTVDLNKIHDIRRYAARLLRSKGRDYGKRLKHQNGRLGFSVFGLGDCSLGIWEHFTDSTIFKILMSL